MLCVVIEKQFYLRRILFLTLVETLFRFDFSLFRTRSLITCHCDFSICNALRHFDASFPPDSSSFSNTMNCFFGKTTSVMTLVTIAFKRASLLLQHITEGRELLATVVPVDSLLVESTRPFDFLALVDFILCVIQIFRAMLCGIVKLYANSTARQVFLTVQFSYTC